MGFQKNIKIFLNSADALLMPSHREGLPMILIEAICTGIPIIGSSVGALNYLVTDNGLLFEPRNINDISDSIRSFSSNKNNFLEIALKKATIFQKRFHPNNWGDQTIKIYRKVLSQK